MTISRSTQIHGTGHTVGEVIDETVRCLPVATASVLGGVKIGSGVSVTGDGTISVAGGGGGGGGSPQPGQPTRFLTLTYTHPGNEDGSSESATTGIPIPDSTIADGAVYIVQWQGIGVISASSEIVVAGNTINLLLFKAAGSTLVINQQSNAYNQVHGAAYSDATVASPDIVVDGENSLKAHFWGMSTDTPTDWTINAQLTPIAP